jgi:hypothetical protein
MHRFDVCQHPRYISLEMIFWGTHACMFMMRYSETYPCAAARTKRKTLPDGDPQTDCSNDHLDEKEERLPASRLAPSSCRMRSACLSNFPGNSRLQAVLFDVHANRTGRAHTHSLSLSLSIGITSRVSRIPVLATAQVQVCNQKLDTLGFV